MCTGIHSLDVDSLFTNYSLCKSNVGVNRSTVAKYQKT
jgi:hypothetical protein